MNAGKVKFLLCISFLFSFLSSAADMSLIRVIGDEREDYTFFKIGSAVLTADKKIVVADNGGHFIASYDWNGTFLKRIGQSGQGPSDFNSLGGLVSRDDLMYVYDAMIQRVTFFDRDLNVKGMFVSSCSISGDFFPLNADRFVCATSLNDPFDRDGGKIKLIDNQGKVRGSFFSKNQFGEEENVRTEEDWMLSYARSIIKMDYSPRHKELLVAFKFATNPMVIQVLSLEGHEKLRIVYETGKQYKFTEFLQKFSPTRPKTEYQSVKVNAVYIQKQAYIVFIDGYRVSKSGEEPIENTALSFSRNGQLQKKFQLPLGLHPLYFSEKGVLLAFQVNEDEPKLYIYQIKGL